MLCRPCEYLDQVTQFGVDVTRVGHGVGHLGPDNLPETPSQPMHRNFQCPRAKPSRRHCLASGLLGDTPTQPRLEGLEQRTLSVRRIFR